MVKHESDYVYTRPTIVKKYTDRILPLVVFIGATALYLYTMSPTMPWGNAAGFAVKNPNLVMPHNPAHPFYDILGSLFLLIPGFSGSFAVNLLSAIFAGLTVMFFSMVVRYLLDIPVVREEEYRKVLAKRKMLAENPELRKEMKDELDLTPKLIYTVLPNLAATSLFAVLLPVWFSGVRADIYSLQSAMIMASLFFSLIGFRNEERQHLLYLGIWIYILSFTNSAVVSLFFVPAYFYLIFSHGINAKRLWSIVSLTIIFLLAAATVYFYLPLNSAAGADAVKASSVGGELTGYYVSLIDSIRFNWEILRADYLMIFKNVGLYLIDTIGWPIIILALAGLVSVLRAAKTRGIFLLFMIFGSLLLIVWNAGFDKTDYASIYPIIPLLAIVVILATAGMIFWQRLSPLDNRVIIFYSIFIAGFVYISCDNNFQRVDLSDSRSPDIFSDEVFSSCGEKAVVFVSDDAMVVPLNYYAELMKPSADIKIISAPSLEFPDYRRRLADIYSDMNYPKGFDAGQRFRPSSVVPILCGMNPETDIFIVPGVAGINSENLTMNGILYKYDSNQDNKRRYTGFINDQLKTFDRIHGGCNRDYNSINILSGILMDIGKRYYESGMYPEAWQSFSRAVSIDTKNIDYRLVYAAYLSRAGEYKDALKLVAEALDIDSRHPASLELGKRIVKAMEEDGKIASSEQVGD